MTAADRSPDSQLSRDIEAFAPGIQVRKHGIDPRLLRLWRSAAEDGVRSSGAVAAPWAVTRHLLNEVERLEGDLAVAAQVAAERAARLEEAQAAHADLRERAGDMAEQLKHAEAQRQAVLDLCQTAPLVPVHRSSNLVDQLPLLDPAAVVAALGGAAAGQEPGSSSLGARSGDATQVAKGLPATVSDSQPGLLPPLPPEAYRRLSTVLDPLPGAAAGQESTDA